MQQEKFELDFRCGPEIGARMGHKNKKSGDLKDEEGKDLSRVGGNFA